MKKIFTSSLLAITTLLPKMAFAFEKSFKGLVNWFVGIVALLVPVIFSLSILVLIWGIFKYVFLSQGDKGKVEESRNIMFYGIIGIFVMASIWGFVRVFNSSLF